MSKDNKEPKIEFAPGCFDGFEGTQEELNELIAELTRLAETGEIFEKAKKVNIEDLVEELIFLGDYTEEDVADFLEEIQSDSPQNPGKTLH